MSISNPTYKDYSFADHGKVYGILETMFSRFGIEYYLIGANARDVHLYKEGIQPNRSTADVDFAVMVPDFDAYNALFKALCKVGFRTVKEPYRLIFDKTDTILDLMPYGEIEQDYTVNFNERELTLSVLGFKEVGEHIEFVEVPEVGLNIPVTPIEGIFILKLVSWSDKPYRRQKDLEDIAVLLKNAWDLYETEAYENHLEIFDDDDFKMQTAAAHIIGKKMRPILNTNKALKHIIVGIIERSIEEKPKAEQPEITIAQQLNMSIAEVQNIMTYLLAGIKSQVT
ncbi:nucleotidyl transferase AbiEii/AbiGii toxin family protein [Hyunsoonleella ulvae]|uniref:nucleotidyl transferase AbiEii/AbiGii toxin family protein n=1 Tax=Hyunsoonleella ulvae TaxID=2799948 RepID=UPI0019393EF1|nr:nucleotidyl transferase AbiEii/AbiGii toxin family protein [Hyunsoonleella ulvae]